jgi:hypothetical protein
LNREIQEVVPSFFHDDSPGSLAKQVSWIQESFDFNDDFIGKLTGIAQSDLASWKSGGSAHEKQLGEVRHFCKFMVHLLDMMNFDLSRARQIIDVKVPRHSALLPGQIPPWAGTTLREFLKARGPQALTWADVWIGVTGSSD